MKKLLFTSLVLLTLLVVTAGTALAGSALELVHVANNGGGPTFTFRVVGEFSDDELAGGFVQVEGGDDFPLYCSHTASDTVVCHTSKKVGGHNVVVGFGGARFWTYVKEYTPRSYCSPIYDWNYPAPYVQWQEFGQVCQEEPPFAGQHTRFTLPSPPYGLGGTWQYTYFPSGSTQGEGGQVWAPAGPGYYYP
jgi:hypothetical protein